MLHHGSFVYPKRVQPGDKVAVLSPSAGLPEIFPGVYETGLRRLREQFHLEPVEYPTTRKMHSPLEERARDVHAAFADPEIKAIIASIGGEDQLKLLKYLDAELLKAHPKPFFGHSDNTNLHIFLWNLGIVSYYGGSIMVHFGRAGAMHPYSVRALQQALFEGGEHELTPAPEYNDEDVDWSDSEKQLRQPEMFPNTGWKWRNAEGTIEGTTWGGCLDIIGWQLFAGKYILPVETYAGKILYLETSEELPSATYVYRVLVGMGERGLLQQFPAILVARPKAWALNQRNTPDMKAKFVAEQEEAILAALNEYHARAMAVFNLDFGHTDPQCIIPNGGKVRIDGHQKRIFVTY
ncbi:MAG: LD-carboxypeptidase [Ktedonobacteraceae bacterium]|nr:LD-carboxypeptidase [Ktedonobacteraceae bacterium]